MSRHPSAVGNKARLGGAISGAGDSEQLIQNDTFKTLAVDDDADSVSNESLNPKLKSKSLSELRETEGDD